jgi:hypothetical protein
MGEFNRQKPPCPKLLGSILSYTLVLMMLVRRITDHYTLVLMMRVLWYAAQQITTHVPTQWQNFPCHTSGFIALTRQHKV